MYNSLLYISIKATGDTYIDTVPIVAGEYTITVDWTTGVVVTVNGTSYSYSEAGNSYGYSTEQYGFGIDSYGYGDSAISFATTLDDTIIGLVGADYFNNTVTEVTV